MTIRKRPRIGTEQIEAFWFWFASEAETLARWFDQQEVEPLTSAFDVQMSLLHRDLAWEIGAGKQTRYALTITSAANRSLRPEVDRVVSAAPGLPDWEFYAARQPGPMPGEVTLHGNGMTVSTAEWRFSPRDDVETGKIDLVIVDPHLSSLDKNSAFSAVFLVLDALLGEDNVEEWIGKITFVSPGDGYHRLYPMHELSYYLAWATTNPEGPLSTARR